MSKFRKNMLNAGLVAVFLIILFSSAPTFAGPASDGIKQTHDEIIRVLHDKDPQSPARAADRRQQLTLLIDERFSCREMARHILGQHWNLLGNKERAQFVRLFQLYLIKSYTHYMHQYADQSLQYVDQPTHNGAIVVRTKLQTRHGDLTLEFWMFERLDEWKVYDVVADGISLVENFRGQFLRILRRSSYETLVKKMREQVCSEPCFESFDNSDDNQDQQQALDLLNPS